MALEFYDMAERCFVMLYIMSDGKTDAKIEKEEFYRQCNFNKLFEMTRDQFKQFKSDRMISGLVERKGDLWQKPN